MYSINPSGDSSGETYQVYCDQTTDGGGWMLLLTRTTTERREQRVGDGRSRPTPRGAIATCTDDFSGYSENDIQDVRFYCETSYHDRIIHFKTSVSGVKEIAWDGDQSTCIRTGMLCYTEPSGHSAYLPNQNGPVCTQQQLADSESSILSYELALLLGHQWECRWLW